MEGIFAEFENENALRSYPFAAGCVPPADQNAYIDEGVFIDAAIYPVNPVGTVYLSGISEEGVFSVSDDTGVIMSGTASGCSVEFFDASGMSRHVGTLVASSFDSLEEFAGRGYERIYSKENSAFSSSCVFPIAIDGVTSISVGGSSKASGSVSFENGPEDEVRVSSSDLGNGERSLRFDVLPRLGTEDGTSIKRILCVVDGQTPFRISRLSYNVVMLKLYGIDKSSVCSAAHREDGFEMADTCECRPKLPSGSELPEAYEMVEVYIPPDDTGEEGGIPEGAENAFFLVVPNVVGYDNPISITLEDGVVSPKTDDAEVVVDGNSAELADGEITDTVTSKGIVIQVPGLSGGES